jgi:hypothetical protein
MASRTLSDTGTSRSDGRAAEGDEYDAASNSDMAGIDADRSAAACGRSILALFFGAAAPE